MRFDKQKFFDGFRDRLDPSIDQEQVHGLEFLLGRFETDPHWTDVRHIAYALATIFHETAGSFQPVEEGYYLGTAKAKRHQKTLRYFPFFGRGYVQLTWKENYAKAGKALGVDLVKDPGLAVIPDVAFDVLTLGLFRGWFGGKLTTYINAQKTDYINARKCVNLLDKAGMIAGYARSFEKILNSAADPVDRTNGPESGEHTPSGNSAGGVSPSSSQEPPPPEANLISAPTIVVDVPQVSAAPETPKEDTLTKIGNKANAAYTAFGTMIAGIIAWFSSSSGTIVVSVMGAVVLLGITYMVINWRRSEAKEKRDLLERQEREKRAHELQKLTLESAMKPELQTVRIVPTPIENSEAKPQ